MLRSQCVLVHIGLQAKSQVSHNIVILDSLLNIFDKKY